MPRLRAGRSAADGATLARADVVALPVSPSSRAGRPRLDRDLAAAAAVLGVDAAAHLRRAARAGTRLGRAGEVVEVAVLPTPGRRTRSVLLVGVGEGTPADWRRFGAAAARRAVGTGRLALAVPPDHARCRAAAEGAGLAAYRFSLATGQGSARHRRPVGRIDLHPLVGPGSATSSREPAAAVRRAQATVDATHLARDLANLPSDRKPPHRLARWAESFGTAAGLDVVVHDERWLRAHGCGGLLGVGSGSAHPPALVVLRHCPPVGDPAQSPVVLVGKGITFDSGGLSLKRGDAMATMKTDMSGAAAVLATMTALARLGVDRPVVGLLALAENMPSGTALRPGDVLTVADGTTVEVLNTDAEGRLVLADALAHAVTELAPAVLVDLATLTGAASLGLGRRHAALYATDETLAAQLLAAGERSGEGVWRMPLVEDYREVLTSDVADISHVARGRPVGAGSVTAALFLQRFTGDRPWAHLDIAGPARADADAFEVSRGGTGYGVRLLLEWLAPQG